jgi:hypothetical protein
MLFNVIASSADLRFRSAAFRHTNRGPGKSGPRYRLHFVNDCGSAQGTGDGWLALLGRVRARHLTSLPGRSIGGRGMIAPTLTDPAL